MWARVKDWEREKSYKSGRILHAYCYTAKLKFSLRFKQLNLEITMHKSDEQICAQTKGLGPGSRQDNEYKLIQLKY